MRKISKKLIFVILLIGLGWFLTPVARVGIFYFSDQTVDSDNLLTGSIVDDASKVNLTKHGGIVYLSSDLNETIHLIRDALIRAKKYGMKIVLYKCT